MEASDLGILFFIEYILYFFAWVIVDSTYGHLYHTAALAIFKLNDSQEGNKLH